MRTRLALFSALLVLSSALYLTIAGCRPTPSCVVSSPRARPHGWTCGKVGDSTECYDGSPCTEDLCTESGMCANPVRSGDCDAGAGWHGVCDASGACCPRPAGSVAVTVVVPLSAQPSAAPHPVR